MKKVSIKLLITFLFISIFAFSIILGKRANAEELYINKKVIDAQETVGDEWKGTSTIVGINHQNFAEKYASTYAAFLLMN